MAQAEYGSNLTRALITGAGAKPSTSPVLAALTEFVAALAGHPHLAIPIYAGAIDLVDRAEHLSRVLSALSVHVTSIVDDTAQNAPGKLDFRNIEGILSDLASDVIGAIQHTADDLVGRIA